MTRRMVRQLTYHAFPPSYSTCDSHKNTVSLQPFNARSLAIDCELVTPVSENTPAYKESADGLHGNTFTTHLPTMNTLKPVAIMKCCAVLLLRSRERILCCAASAVRSAPPGPAPPCSEFCLKGQFGVCGTACSACPPGTYSDRLRCCFELDAIACTPCPSGTFKYAQP